MGKKSRLQIVRGGKGYRGDEAPGMEMDRRTFLKGVGGTAGIQVAKPIAQGLAAAGAFLALTPRRAFAIDDGDYPSDWDLQYHSEPYVMGYRDGVQPDLPPANYRWTFTNANIDGGWFLTSHDWANNPSEPNGPFCQKCWLRVRRVGKHSYTFDAATSVYSPVPHGWGSDKNFYFNGVYAGQIYSPNVRVSGTSYESGSWTFSSFTQGTYTLEGKEDHTRLYNGTLDAGIAIPTAALWGCSLYFPPFKSALEKRWWGDSFETGKLEGKRPLPTGNYRFYVVHAGTKWYLDTWRLSPDGTNVCLWHDLKPNVTQLWTVTHKRWGDRAGGYVQLASGGNMVMKLSDGPGWGESGGNVVLWHDDDAGDKNWCRWIPEESGKTDGGHKGYVLHPSTNPALALMPDNGPWADEHNVIMGKTIGNDPDLYTWYAEPMDGAYSGMQAEVDRWLSDGVELPRISPYGPSGRYNVYNASSCSPSTCCNGEDAPLPTGQGNGAISVLVDYDYWIREAGSCSQLRRDSLTRCFYDQGAPATGARIEFAGWPQKAKIRLKVRPAIKVASGVPNGCYKVAAGGSALTFAADPGYCRINEGDDSYCTLRAASAPADRFIVINHSDGTVRVSPWRNAACALRPSTASSNVRSTPYNGDAAFLWEAKRRDDGKAALRPHGATTGLAANGALASGEGAAWALAVSEEDPLSFYKPADGWHLVFQRWYYYLSGVKQTGWLAHGGERYWLDLEDGACAEDRLVTPEEGAGYYAYARPGGAVVRGKWLASDGVTYLADNDGRLEAAGDYVGDKYGSWERYYIDPERHGCVPGYDPKRKVCVMSDGRVVRGKYQDPSTGVWYLADNDGKLEVGEPGWLVTDAYGDGLQRYYIEPEVGGAVPGFSEHGWFHYTTGKGYVLINDTIGYCGATWKADNNGLLTKA